MREERRERDESRGGKDKEAYGRDERRDGRRGDVEGMDRSRIEDGSKIEGNYRGKGKWYTGKVTRDRRDGTFDVAYDDGENESRVDETLLRLLGSKGGLERRGDLRSDTEGRSGRYDREDREERRADRDDRSTSRFGRAEEREIPAYSQGRKRTSSQ
jgi:hypothetical protein